MFNSSNGYSLADIAAATGNNNRNDGMWDNGGAWWIIILFLFCFNGGMWAMVLAAVWVLDLLLTREPQLVRKSLMVSI